jgi:RNA polymerase sigma factor (sigma-70 family)
MQITEQDLYHLAKACAEKNMRAQQLLYEHFKTKMFGVCLRYANNRQDAEDYLHDGFKDIHQFKGQGSLEGWMRRVVVRNTLKNIKKQKLIDFFPDNLVFDKKVEDQEAYSIFKDESIIDLTLQLLQSMPTGFRTVINLFILENYSHAEIAAELGITEGTSKSQLNRAKAHLRSALEKKLTE